ncbi:hypothetical protein [Streptomyces sp. CoH17]|uniref:hypothetical protein n=1 Tax=Streptomyces sp. CoH17 TaxID=2992806 RepID=UPI00226E4A8C|nr:hypothetical protein [Streptomyces sp. CoH17]
MDPNYVWGGLFTAGLAYEAYALFTKVEGDTLSERTRALFKVHTKPGRAIFTVAWGGFSLWFLQHIINQNM